MGATAPVWVGIGSLVVSDQYQGREKLSKQTVDEYAELIETTGNPWPFSSPCTVYRVKGEQILVDGFHRLHAVQKRGEDQVQCIIIDGTRTDALKAVASANQAHGLRRSNNDKRRLVRLMLEDATLSKWSDHKLAELCGVSHPFVGQIRGELETVTSSPAENTRVSSNGATRPATKADADMQRQKIVAAIVANEGQPDREIARLVGCDHKTVGKVRKAMEAESQSAVAIAEPDEETEPEQIDEDPVDLLDVFVAIQVEIRLLLAQVPMSDRESMWRQVVEKLNSEDVSTWK